MIKRNVSGERTHGKCFSTFEISRGGNLKERTKRMAYKMSILKLQVFIMSEFMVGSS